MTWLFTQVWLWSLAAFLLGSFIAWALFALPLRRRVRLLSQRCAELEYLVETAAPTGDGRHASRGSEGTALDLLRPDQEWEHPERPEVTAVHSDAGTASAQQPEAGSPLAAWDSFRRDAADPAEESAAERTMQVSPVVTDPVAEDVRADEPAQAGETEPVSDEPVRQEPGDDSELRLEEQRETPPLAASSELGRWPESTLQTPQPTAPPEPDLSDTELADPDEDISTSNSTWFQKKDLSNYTPSAEWSGTLDVPQREQVEPLPPAPGGSAPSNGQLRSLFEPVDGEAEAAVPYVPPLGADATQSIPAVVDDADADDADENADADDENPVAEEPEPAEEEASSAPAARADNEPPPLPRRTPGAGPMPGSPSRSQPTVQIPKLPSRSVDRPDVEYVVKGHFASKQYHTPDSPHYERVMAEVWFRTASEAEQAGFAPWDGWHRD